MFQKIITLYALADLKARFRHHSNTVINRIFHKCGKLLVPSVKQLQQQGGGSRKSRRPDRECRALRIPMPLQFWKERKFIELEEEIVAEKSRRDKGSCLR